jgi:hypothetical protein
MAYRREVRPSRGGKALFLNSGTESNCATRTSVFHTIYDALNRVGSVSETQMNEAGQWGYGVVSQSFSYDRYGNRGISAASWGQGVNKARYTADAARNRFTQLG